MSGLDDVGIVVSAGAAASDVAHLGAPVLGIDVGLKLQHVPVGTPVSQSGDILITLLNVRCVFHFRVTLHASPNPDRAPRSSLPAPRGSADRPVPSDRSTPDCGTTPSAGARLRR